MRANRDLLSNRETPDGVPESIKSSNPIAGHFRNQRWDLMLRINRGNKTPLEFFLGDVAGWDIRLQQ